MTDHTPYQKGIIRRFYEHRDTLALQKLAEIVSDLYLEESEAKRRRLWKSAHSQMLAAGMHKLDADHILKEEDLGALAEVVRQLS